GSWARGVGRPIGPRRARRSRARYRERRAEHLTMVARRRIAARSDLPCGIDDRVAKLREEAPVVEVPPRVEIGPMVGSDGAPSAPQHPAAPEDEAEEAPPRVEVPRRAGAGEDAV